MNLRAAWRWGLATAAAWLGACAQLPTASDEERFAKAYMSLLPVPELMAQAAAKDPQWPLGEKAALVSAQQLDCMRQVLAPEAIADMQRELARDYARAHPQDLAEELQVLEAGAAPLIGQAMRAGAGLPQTGPLPTPEQGRALVAFASQPRFARLRRFTGLERLAGGGASPVQRGQDIARAMTVNFLTEAFLRCHIPVKLLY